MEHTAFIALGANVGERQATLEAALDLLDALPDVSVRARAPWLESMPVDCPPGSEPFVNGAAKLFTSLDPHSLMRLLLVVERQFGRVREGAEINGPRTIDLDLLLFDDLVIDSPELILPHPRMLDRSFVLQPLAAITDEEVHPHAGKTIGELLKMLSE